MQRILFNLILAMEGVMANRLRAVLTALGIIFGVGAVITMLGIGTGAKQSILDQMKLIGTNNIVIKSVSDFSKIGGATEISSERSDEKRPWSPGLSLEDVRSLQSVLPNLEAVSPEVVFSVNLIQSGKMETGKCVGVTNEFFDLNQLELLEGNLFHKRHVNGGRPVCIIGKEIKNKFFPDESPIGKQIKCGKAWMQIIGVLEQRSASEESLKDLGIRDYNADVYVPVTTALLRFNNRAKITKADIKSQFEERSIPENYHQLDKITVRVKDSEYLRATADLTARILKRRHLGLVDFEIEVPELLLQQQRKTQDTFNMVLAFIAGISLLVGGIGIMNIMLASVLERIKEIGLRRSLGAYESDIVQQFLFEAIFISLMGGLLGVILGYAAAKIIETTAEIPTVVTWWSVLLSFGVASSVGLIFGLFPARKAAKQDPIKALRAD